MSDARHHHGWPDRAGARSGHRLTTIALATAVAAVILALTGCAAAGPGRIDDGRVRVVVSFYPPQFITEQVGGDDVSIINLTAPGASSHDVELRPSQIIDLTRADLVVSMAGYNTTIELLNAGTPALLIPRSGPSAEQRTRARLFAKRDWVRWLDPDLLGVPSVTDAIVAALTRPLSPTQDPDLGGRQAAVARLTSRLEAGSKLELESVAT